MTIILADKALSRRGRRTRTAFTLLATVCLMGLPLAAWTQEPDDARPVEDELDYWQRGAYREALETLRQKIAATNGYYPPRLDQQLAQLLFLNGRVDEAIQVMEKVAEDYAETANTLDLALLYKYRGQKDKYEAALRRAASQANSAMYRYTRRDDNYIAIGRIMELQGENPKTVLNVYKTLTDRNPQLIEAHIAAGDLAYRKQSYAVAEGHYLKALAIDAKNQDALAGLAECYWKSYDGRLEDTLQRLLDINPNHPRARAIQAEQLLDLGKTKEALRIIEDALSINPNNLPMLSLKSAALFLENDLDGMKAVQEYALNFNPLYSELFQITGRIASRHYRFQEGLEFQRRALQIDPNDYTARALYTQDLMRLGHESEGRDELERAFEADPYNVLLANQLKLMDTLATFEVIEDGPFVLKLPKNETPVLASEALELLHRAFAHYEEKYAVKLETPVLVEMFDNHDDFMVRSIGLPGNVGHLGICFGKLVTMDSPSARPPNSSNWRSVLWHEFVHVVTLQKTKNRMPRWLSEGLSVYEEAAYSPAFHNALDPQYAAVIADNDPPGIRDIGKFFTQPPSPGHLMFGYFTAGEFARYYIETYGIDAMNAALDSIAVGKNTEDALAEAAGVSERTLDKEFQTRMKERLAPLKNLPAIKASGPGRRDAAVLQSLAEAAGADAAFPKALERAAQAIKAEDWAAAEAALKEAYELFPDYTGPDAPLRQLAQVYECTGNAAAHRETLERVLYSSPTEIGAAEKLLAIYQAEKNWAKVAEVADWAIGINPFDVKWRQARLTGLIETGQDEQALDTLAVLAHLDAPRATDHRLARAEILARRGQFAPAKQEVITVLEELPHYWKAQELLLKIVEGGAVGPGTGLN